MLIGNVRVLRWLAERQNGTDVWLTGRDKMLKSGTVPPKTGRMVSLTNMNAQTTRIQEFVPNK